ncbi:MAG: alpha/beta hydrolase [Phycisphaeraceae bacterium]|nr:alpha/beta hydrolase [Phycisphaeraceae bacterium]
MRRVGTGFVGVVLAAMLAGLFPVCASAQVLFRVRIDPGINGAPYTGRLYVAITPAAVVEPRLEAGNWFEPPRILALDVEGLAPGAWVSIDGSQINFPGGEIGAGAYAAQAFGRLNPDSPEPGRGVGDPYSAAVRFKVEEESAPDEAIELVLDRVVESEPFEETDRIRLVEMVSPSLSAFHGREVVMRAGVRLPREWEPDGSRTYPTVYWITGFGGDHTSIVGLDRMLSRVPGADECLIVVPDASCYWGHSVFADSATNGPRGRALVEELIPGVEARFRGAGERDRRAVTGGSSGGWAALWLQVMYPDSFGSCWSHCPDPVDFRDFQRINLYEPGANMYRDHDGNARPLARRNGEVILEYEPFVRMEDALGPGGQIASFEAVFSPRGADGGPLRLFDRETGEVDHEVARTWEPYDIRLYLERNWERVGAGLAGRLHVFAGSLDTFYLEGAVALLAESLSALGSDAEVKIVEGMGHTVYPDGVRRMFVHLVERERERDPAGEAATVESGN